MYTGTVVPVHTTFGDALLAEHEPEPHCRDSGRGDKVDGVPAEHAGHPTKGGAGEGPSYEVEGARRGGREGWIRVHHPGLAPASEHGVAVAA